MENALLIIIDQLRADYGKYMPRCAKLLPYHAICDTNSIPPSTEAMHANISTGVYPKDHGFVSKNTANGTVGLDQILTKLRLGNLSSLASFARQYKLSPHILGGKPETVKVMGKDDECALRVYSNKLDVDGENESLIDLVEEYKRSIIVDFPEYEGIADALLNAYKLIKEKSGTFTIFTLPESDILGHKYGPHSQELINHLQSLDNSLSEIIRDIYGDSLIIIMGDHGCRNVDSYLIEYDKDNPRKIMLYDKFGGSFVCSGGHILEGYRAIQYDGGMIRIWFDESQNRLSEKDKEFLSNYGKIVYSEDDLVDDLKEVYGNSHHENLGDVTIFADKNILFCKRSWAKGVIKPITERKNLGMNDLPLGEHGSYHKEDREVLFMSNYHFKKHRLLNVDIRNMIEESP